MGFEPDPSPNEMTAGGFYPAFVNSKSGLQLQTNSVKGSVFSTPHLNPALSSKSEKLMSRFAACPVRSASIQSPRASLQNLYLWATRKKSQTFTDISIMWSMDYFQPMLQEGWKVFRALFLVYLQWKAPHLIQLRYCSQCRITCPETVCPQKSCFVV